MVGKVSYEKLNKIVFKRLGKKDRDIIVGPKVGEDSASIKIGKKFLVVSSDPIIFAEDRIGALGIHIAANDVAASGAVPRWMSVVLFLPDNPKVLDKITKQLHREAKRLGISIIGGHSEYAPEIRRPFISLTCFGITNRFIPTSGAKPGDKIILTKGAAIEATGIIATDFEKELIGRVPRYLIKRAKKRLNQISVVKEALVISKYANAMHDPTEGGIIDGLLEVAIASRKKLIIDKSKIKIHEDTKAVSEAVNVNPLKIFSSGALIATIPRDKANKALKILKKNNIDAWIIGEVKNSKKAMVILGNEKIEKPVRDELYDLWV